MLCLKYLSVSYMVLDQDVLEQDIPIEDMDDFKGNSDKEGLANQRLFREVFYSNKLCFPELFSNVLEDDLTSSTGGPG